MAEIERNLISLYSRNMMLLSKLDNGVLTCNAETERLFKESHNFDGFGDYLKAHIEGKIKNKRVIVFTLSQPLELEPVLQPFLENIRILTAEDFLSIKALSRDSILQDWSNGNKFIIFRLRGKEEWRLIEAIKKSVDSVEIKEGHSVTIVAHHSFVDLYNNAEVQTSITFMTKEWKMLVMDDIKSCKYDWFLRTLGRPKKGVPVRCTRCLQ